MKRIFITGPIGCGKSTLIRTVLGDSLSVAGGFVTERIYEGEELVGFDLVSPGITGSPRDFISMENSVSTENSVSQKQVLLDSANLGLYEKAGHLHLRFLTFKDGKVKRNNKAFSIFASALLREAGTMPFAIIDEIGGFEILIPEFMEAFEMFLESQVPCVGVLKSLPSAKELSKTVSLDSEYLIAAKHLRLRLASDPETEIVELNGHEDKHALNKLRNWKDQYLRDGELK
ncbi:MAG: hypothetical protein GX218_07125 [Clostridiaceae bacterium]|nr:hypothetical protein [Clostridiaceae bacterium]